MTSARIYIPKYQIFKDKALRGKYAESYKWDVFIWLLLLHMRDWRVAGDTGILCQSKNSGDAN